MSSAGLRWAVEASEDEEGWANLGAVGAVSQRCVDAFRASCFAVTDKAGVRQAQRIMAQSALAAHGREWVASATARTDAELEQWIRQNADTIYHPVGTCRMGQDAMAVVDPQLRVRGVPGLRVVDASVMPSVVSGNTNAPTIMMAERAADWIRQAVRA